MVMDSKSITLSIELRGRTAVIIHENKITIEFHSFNVDTPPQKGVVHLPIPCIPRTIRAVHLDHSASKWNGKGTLQ